MQGLLFGLGSALCWGLADVVATVTSRRAGVLRSQLAMQAIGAVALTPVLLVAPRTGRLDLLQILMFAGLGLLVSVAFLAFFRALQDGPIAIVSPIVSAYAVVVLLLAVLFLGERPSPGQLTGIGVTIAGVVLTSADLRELRAPRMGRGVVLALVALVGFGITLFAIGRAVRELSWFLPSYLIRVFAIPPLVMLSAARRTWPWQVRGGGVLGMLALLALLDTTGTLSYGLGTSRGLTSVVATAASAYALVPIAFGVLVFRERFSPNQAVGIGLVLAGLVTLGASTT
jgi:drug/metabolite transporter (DMT)-like permease